MKLQSLTRDEVRSLDSKTLAHRMDNIREVSQLERHGPNMFKLQSEISGFPRVADLLETKAATQLDEEGKKKLADIAFRFLLQLDLLIVASGIGNKVLYGRAYTDSQWASPAYQMRNAVLGQYQIVASRIALECFFELIHVAHKKKRMDGKSKFRAFKKWVAEPDNPYRYFVGHIIEAFVFDREHRQREIHGTSRFPQRILRLEKPDIQESTKIFDLTNILLNVWSPLIKVMNGKKPNSLPIFDSTEDVADKYFQAEPQDKEFEAVLIDLLERKRQGKD